MNKDKKKVWRPFRDFKKVFEESYPNLEYPECKWNIEVDVYGKGEEDTMAEINLTKNNIENFNVCIEKDNILLIKNESELSSKGSSENNEECFLDKVIPLHRNVRKIVLKAVLDAS